MRKSLLETLSQSSSSALRLERRHLQYERRSGWRGGRRDSDFADQTPAPAPGLKGTARFTWVHDHDTLEEQYVN
jgi:hypothetical protein